MASLEWIFELMAERASVVHGQNEEAAYGGGGDIDCIVDGLDPNWPLRLGPAARLVNRLRYDVTGTSWFVSTAELTAAVDSLEDPEGIGKYGFKTGGIAGPPLVPPGAAAAYLALKRLRKKDLREGAWAQVAELAAADPDGFSAKLRESLPRSGGGLAEGVLEGRRPDASAANKARGELRRRRLGSPDRALRYAGLLSARASDRLFRPTGLYVLIAGPDGTGKSTIAEALIDDPFGFRRSLRTHWRPGLLPGSGAGDGDVTSPHEREPRGKAMSIAVALYHWADFVLGSVVIVAPARRRSTLIVAERGWWDLAVDSRRYRLDVPPGFVRFLGRFIAGPDLVLRLDGKPEVIASRKGEISLGEVERQLIAWDNIATAAGPTRAIDVGGTIDGSLGAASDAVRSATSVRTLRNLNAGWVAVPRASSARWWLPRGPRLVASAPFKLWSPMTRSGSLGWSAGRKLAGAGLLRLLPRAVPPVDVVDAIGPFLGRGENVAIARMNHPGRFLVLIVSADGSVRRIAKVVTDGDASPLAREADALEGIALRLPAPLLAPKLLERTERVLVTEAVVVRMRAHPEHLPAEVAEALGAFAHEGWVHGDFAPWNLLLSDSKWVLVDWESARQDNAPFHDLFHYLVQGHSLLGSPTSEQLLAGIVEGAGWIGQSVAAYSVGAQLDRSDALGALETYLIDSNPDVDLTTEDGARALPARERLLRSIRSR